MNDTLKTQVKTLSAGLADDLVVWRRHLHRYPELSGEEHQTAAFVREILISRNIPFIDGIAGTGIVAMIQGDQAGEHCIALRADMDALPIQEAGDKEWKSTVPGVMHACGHDAHTTSLLGTAIILSTLRPHFGGLVKLFFQPAEERYPGGAQAMIDEGVLEDPHVDLVFGQHIMPGLESGKVGFRPGPAMAATNEIYMSIQGKGGHGATPELINDPVVAAAQVLIALQQVVSRKANPQHPTVLSFGRFIADGQVNVVPDEVIMHGIFRTYDETWREQAHSLIRHIAATTAEAFGCRSEVHIAPGYPSLINHPDTTERARVWAEAYLGRHQAVEIPPRMTAEDFAYFSRQRPSCFYRLGTHHEGKGLTANLHTPRFDIDEEILPAGAGLMAWITLCAMEALDQGWKPAFHLPDMTA